MKLVYIPLIVIPLLISVGQLLFKSASGSKGLINSSALVSFVTNPYLIIALLIYFLSTLWWVIVLKSVPLTRAYIFMALSFVYVPVMAHIFFGETFNLRITFGIVCVIAGICIIGSQTEGGIESSKAALSRKAG